MCFFRVFLISTILFVTTLLIMSPAAVDAQQQGEQRRSMQVQLGSGLDSYLFVDELGLEMTLVRFFESYLDMETYVLGPGDLLGFTLKGNVSGTLRGVRVNSQGVIMLPQVGTLKVDGLLFAEAEKLINEKIAEALPGTESDMILEHPRNLKINVVGNIPFPGPHIVMPQTRLDQAIYHSFFKLSTGSDDDDDDDRRAGPLSPFTMLANKYPQEFLASNSFALRNIVISREDGSQVTADLYRFLKTGDDDANPVVMQGDIIHIQRFYEHNPRISVSGAVNQALEMEYHPDDTIYRLIEMAGGMTFDATEEYVRVSRVTDQGLQEEILEDSSSIAAFELKPNDRIIIPFDRDKRYTENVQVYGEALYTGRFSIQDGKTTLYELMQLVGGLTDMALPQAAYLMRTQPGRTEYGTRPAFDPVALRRTSDQFAQGFEYLALEAQLIRNRVHIDLNDEEAMRKVVLYHGDRLHIPKNEGTVFVFGQVNQPGYYNFEESKSTLDFISTAGGLALSADADRTFIIKAESNSWYRAGDVVIEPGDLIFVDRVPFDELQAARAYDLQKRTQRNSNIQLIMTGLTTITSIITAYVAITR